MAEPDASPTLHWHAGTHRPRPATVDVLHDGARFEHSRDWLAEYLGDRASLLESWGETTAAAMARSVRRAVECLEAASGPAAVVSTSEATYLVWRCQLGRCVER